MSRCTCLSIADRVRAELEAVDVRPCELHEPEAHKRRQVAEARATADAERVRIAEALGGPPTPVVVVDPLEAALAAKVRPANVLPLNADPSDYPALRGFLPVADNTRPIDGPDAA